MASIESTHQPFQFPTDVQAPQILARIDDAHLKNPGHFRISTRSLLDFCDAQFPDPLSYSAKEYLLDWLSGLKAVSDRRKFRTVANSLLETRYVFKEVHLEKLGKTIGALVLNRSDLRINKDDQEKFDIRKVDYADLYGLNEHCYLCHTIGKIRKGEENTDQIPASDIVIRLAEYGPAILIPNKFPVFVGHGLIVPLHHDRNPKKTKRINHVLDPEYLEAVENICDSHELVAWMNNPTGGMSIPVHNHFHVALRAMGIPGFKDLAQSTTRFIQEIKPNAPFETVIISGPDRNKSIEAVCKLAASYEQRKISYNIGYTNGVWLVIPRYDTDRKIINQSGILLGAPIPLQFFFSDYVNTFDERMRYAFNQR